MIQHEFKVYDGIKPGKVEALEYKAIPQNIKYPLYSRHTAGDLLRISNGGSLLNISCHDT